MLPTSFTKPLSETDPEIAAVLQNELNRQRTQLAKNVVRIAESQSLPSVEVLDNFDAIQRMGQPAQADEELLALLP